MRCARPDGRGAADVPERARHAHCGRSALHGDPRRRQLLRRAGDFGGSGCSREARSRRVAPARRNPHARKSKAARRGEKPARQEKKAQPKLRPKPRSLFEMPASEEAQRDEGPQQEPPTAAPLTHYHRLPRARSQGARQTTNPPLGGPLARHLRPWKDKGGRWNPRASSSIRTQSRQLPDGWSRFWSDAGSRGGSLSMRLSLRGASGSSAPGSTRTRSSWGW